MPSFSAGHLGVLGNPHWTWSPALLLALAEHARAAYLPFDAYQVDAMAAGFDGAVTIERGATQVAIAYSPRAIVVSARGSEQCGDWGENLMVLRRGWRGVLPFGARVHAGFLRQAKRVEGVVVDRVQALLLAYPRARVFVTGHSLGGALAVLLACLLVARLPDVVVGRIAWLSLSAPRVGNRAFRDHVSLAMTGARLVVVNRGVQDLVTRLPFSAWGYRHVGEPFILRDGELETGAGAWQGVRALQEVRPLAGWRVVSRLTLGAQSHLAGRLLAALRRYARRGA